MLSRDGLRKTVILSEHDLHARSQQSSRMLGSPNCSQYLEDYRSYLEHKDRDEPTDVDTGCSKPKNTAERPSKLHSICGKFRSPSAPNDYPAPKVPSSPVPSRGSTVQNNSVGGSIIGPSQRPFAKLSPRGHSGSLRSLAGRRSSQLDDAGSERMPLSKSATNLQSIDGFRSTKRLSSIGIAIVELKSDRNDKVLTRKSEEAAVQTDPELNVNDVQHSCVQTDDVRDYLSYSESDVSIGGYKDTKSDQDDDRYDVRSHTEEDDGDYREDEDFPHGEDENQPDTGRFTFSFEDLTSSRPDGINQRRCSSLSGKARNREFDSGIGNTVSQELSSFGEGIVKGGQRRSTCIASNDGSRHKPQQRLQQSSRLSEIKDFHFQDSGQQTVDFSSTQTPLKLPAGLKRAQLKVIGDVALGDWLSMDSGQESGIYLEPWTMLRMTEVEKRKDNKKLIRDFATQTAEPVTSLVQVSCETQTNTEEWRLHDQSAYPVENSDLESDLCHHRHTSRPFGDRSENVAEVREDGGDDGEDRWSAARAYNDQWDDNLTDEIIQVFRDTQRLIAKAKAGKQPETELNSGKKQLLERMLREVKNLKDRVGRMEGGAGDVRASGKDGGRRRRRKPTTTLTDSDSEIESSEADEDEERRRRTEPLLENPHDRHYGPRRKDRSWRHSERNSSMDRGRRGGRSHSKLEPDSRYKHRISRPDRAEHIPDRHLGFQQNAPLPISQELPPQYQRNVSFPQDPRFWSRPVQGPPPAQYQRAPLWHNQRPTDPVTPNMYPGQFPHTSTAPVSIPVPAAPSIYWRQPTPLTTLLPNQHIPHANHTSLWSGTGKLGLGGAFRPTQATLQKPNVIFFPGTPVGAVHTVLPGQGHQSVLLSQQGSVSYVPTQSSLFPSSQPSEVLRTEGRPVAVRPAQRQGLPMGTTQEVTKSVSTPQYPPQPSVQRRRKGRPSRWKDEEFEFTRSIKQAAMEAEQIKELSNRLLRQTGSQAAI